MSVADLKNDLAEQSTEVSRVSVSFEFFPPNTPAMDSMLWDSIEHQFGFGCGFVNGTGFFTACR